MLLCRQTQCQPYKISEKNGRSELVPKNPIKRRDLGITLYNTYHATPPVSLYPLTCLHVSLWASVKSPAWSATCKILSKFTSIGPSDLKLPQSCGLGTQALYKVSSSGYTGSRTIEGGKSSCLGKTKGNKRGQYDLVNTLLPQPIHSFYMLHPVPIS